MRSDPSTAGRTGVMSYMKVSYACGHLSLSMITTYVGEKHNSQAGLTGTKETYICQIGVLRLQYVLGLQSIVITGVTSLIT